MRVAFGCMEDLTDDATDTPTTPSVGADAADGGDAAAERIEQLEATVEQLRKDLWTARDAVIGAEAEVGASRVRIRELETLVNQLRDALAAQTRWARLVGRLTGNRYVSTLITKAKALLRP